MVYDDGTRVDYTIWPENVAERVVEESSLPESLDVGYRVLLDKDGRTSGWRPPTYRAHVPARPTRSEYDALTDEFWWNVRDVAKGLWRGEVFFAKFMRDYDLKFVAFRRFLEWRVEIDHD